MKYNIKKIYLILFFTISLTNPIDSFGKNNNNEYSKDNISNYFSGIISSNYNSTSNTYKFLSKVPSLKSRHSNYNVKFLRALVLLKKFDQAISFSENIWKEEEFFFEADLLLGLNYFVNENYLMAEKHFSRQFVFSV